MAKDYTILQEADAGAYMASLGVGPEVIGLVQAGPRIPQPALVMSYLYGSRDLYSLLHGYILTP